MVMMTESDDAARSVRRWSAACQRATLNAHEGVPAADRRRVA
jgi:hypothetical protein